MNVGGIDLSTKAVDVVAIDEDDPSRCQHLRIALDGGWWDAARAMRSHAFFDAGVYAWLDGRNVRLVGIERPYSQPSHIGSATKLHAILGAVLASLPASVHAFEVSPNEMRRELGLPGNCDKGAMRAEVYSRLRRGDDGFGWPDDAYDAWAAAYATLRMNERAPEVTR
jgi:hypothetical protein